jgi:methionyl-tRNA formyltransferase
MRVYILIFKSRLFTPPVVEHVAVSGKFDVVGVGGVAPTRAGSFRKWLSAQTEYWGVWGSFWIIAATLFRALPEKLRFPRPFRRLSSLRSVCAALEIPYADVADVNEAAFLKSLASRDIDVLICFQQQIFRKELLALPRLGCLNVHTGILPGYRGMKPVFWMHSRNEPELGVSVHAMSESLDVGPVVVQRRWRRRPGSSVLENQFWSYRCAAQCIVEAIEKLPVTAMDMLPQVSAETPYFKAPTKRERDRAVRAGTRLV